MRTITNNANFPQPLFKALANDGYTGGGGDTSITRLINPPRISTLRFFHEDEIVEDASDRIWAVMGQAGHKVLENSADGTMRVESTLRAKFNGIDGPDGTPIVWVVTGTPDLYVPQDEMIYDYKFTSVWSLMFGEKPEWERQVNMQAMFHRIKGDKVTKGAIVALLRDWSKRKSTYEKDYPQTQAQIISLPLWPQEEAIEYTKRRVRLHQKSRNDYQAAGFNDSALPLCTEEERWYRGGGWAVKKQDAKGKVNKKADRVYGSKTDALQHITDNASSLPKGKTFAPLEERKGENIRCMSYCDVWSFCSFGKKLHEEAAASATANPEGELALDSSEE